MSEGSNVRRIGVENGVCAEPALARMSRRGFLARLGTGSAALAAGSMGLIGCAGAEVDVAGNSSSSLAPTARAGAEGAPEGTLAKSFVGLTRETEWSQVDVVSVGFDAHHPQGMTKVGDSFFMSSVETTVEPEKYGEIRDGYDRSPGEGVGHLFKFGADGELIDEITLGEDTIYHPGGIAYDGRYIWVPVAEYRPDSSSIIYRVDPESLEATEVFRFPDHVGGLVPDPDASGLHGVSWGSRRLYRWILDDSSEVTDADRPPEELFTFNKEYYVDYQDCEYVESGMMLCSGVAAYQPPNAPEFNLGGIDLIDLQTNALLHQVPVPLWTEEGLTMTQNPFFVEERGSGLRFYFVPEDNDARLFVYDVEA